MTFEHIGTAIAWTIDAAGKLGPVIVAVMVYRLGRAQGLFTENITRKQHEVDRRELQLAMLDKRAEAIGRVEQERASISTKTRNFQPLLSALSQVEALFGEQVVYQGRQIVSLCDNCILQRQHIEGSLMYDGYSSYGNAQEEFASEIAQAEAEVGSWITRIKRDAGNLVAVAREESRVFKVFGD